MNYLAKILIPLALGILAAFVNYLILSSSTAKLDFVTVDKEVPRDAPIELINLRKLSVPKEFQGLRQTMVPWNERGVLSGKRVLRPIRPNDPIFFADTDFEGDWLDLKDGEKLFPVNIGELEFDPTLLRIGNYIQFRVSLYKNAEPEWIGPYRVVAVGSKLRNDQDGPTSSRQSSAQSIGIAYNKENPSMGDSLTKLELFCDAQRAGNAVMLSVLIEEIKNRR